MDNENQGVERPTAEVGAAFHGVVQIDYAPDIPEAHRTVVLELAATLAMMTRMAQGSTTQSRQTMRADAFAAAQALTGLPVERLEGYLDRTFARGVSGVWSTGEEARRLAPSLAESTLRKYVRHVGQMEGETFVPASVVVDPMSGVEFTQEELDLLQRVEAQAREEKY